MWRTLELTCTNLDCPAVGRLAKVHLTLVTPGVYAVQRYVCAECRSDMRLIGGLWINIGGGASCPGSSCSTSPETQQPSGSVSAPSPQRTARATGRRSTRSTTTATADSAAGSKVGIGGEVA